LPCINGVFIATTTAATTTTDTTTTATTDLPKYACIWIISLAYAIGSIVAIGHCARVGLIGEAAAKPVDANGTKEESVDKSHTVRSRKKDVY
jgi:hypothetical protein